MRRECGRWVENIWSGRITERNWEEERCKRYKSREEKVLLQSTLINLCLEQGIQVRGVVFNVFDSCSIGHVLYRVMA